MRRSADHQIVSLGSLDCEHSPSWLRFICFDCRVDKRTIAQRLDVSKERAAATFDLPLLDNRNVLADTNPVRGTDTAKERCRGRVLSESELAGVTGIKRPEDQAQRTNRQEQRQLGGESASVPNGNHTRLRHDS
jgi:hypothetical protein